MGAARGPEDIDVSDSGLELALRDHPQKFEFFQAVRLLERLQADREPVGWFAKPEREVASFGVNNSLIFPPSQIHSLDWTPGKKPRLIVNFMGLTGNIGILPYAYTEYIIERMRAKDRTIEAFFDIFNHRMISLFYQAWEKYRFAVAYERNQRDRFSKHVMALIGLGTEGLQNRQPVPDQSLLFYAGLLSMQARSGVALEQLVADYFNVPVKVEQFVGAWYPIKVREQCRFEDNDSISTQLGFGVIVGDAVWDQQVRVRIKIGPLPVARYLDFLPSGKAYNALRAVTDFYGRGDVEFEVQLFLKQDDVPHCYMGEEGPAAPMLGWFSWMKSKPDFDRSPGDAIFLLN
jgi:type VI secretion system protein ImpH